MFNNNTWSPRIEGIDRLYGSKVVLIYRFQEREKNTKKEKGTSSHASCLVLNVVEI
jgi:hypothetical protein